MENEELYYIVDTRQVVGNCILFWQEGSGYTCNLDKARKFTRKEAEAITNNRRSDKPYSVSFIDSKAYRHVDHQNLRDE